MLDTVQYASQAAAQTAISNGLPAKATNELYELELAKLGYVIYGYVTPSIDNIVQVVVDKDTLRPSGSSNDTQQASLITTDTTSFTGILSSSDTNVQVALNTVSAWGASTTNHGVVLGRGVNSAVAATVGTTGTVLTGVTGADPAFSAMPSVTSITTTGGATIRGTTVINDTGNANTTIGTGTSDTVTIQGSANTITGVTDINVDTNKATNINTGSSTSAVTLGGGANTIALAGATNTVSGPLTVTGATTLNTSLSGFLKATAGLVSSQATIATTDTDATSTDTASTLVKRDASGDFAASTITANKVTGLNTPTGLTDAANKQYVDTNTGGLDVKTSVRLVAVTDVANIHTSTGAISIDGQTIVTNDRILLTAQTSGNASIDNGIWVASTTGAWTRPSDFDTGDSAVRTYCLVTDGTTYINTGWYCTTPTPATIDTTALTFVQFTAVTNPTVTNVGSGAGVYKTTVGSNCEFRKLNSDSSNLVVTQNTDDITFSPAANPSLTGLTVHGTTALNTAASDATNTTIGLNGFNKVGIGGAIGTTMLKVTGTTELTEALTVSNGGAAITGATTLNTSGSSNTTIGNASSITTITSPTNINTTGSSDTQIGNSANTTTMLGATTINGSGAALTTIGNSGSTVALAGGTNSINGTATINTTASAGNTNIGNTGNTVGITGSTNTVTGAANINTTAGNGDTSIGNTSNTVGITGSTNTITGTTVINHGGTASTQINTTANTGTVAIGNGSNEVDMYGGTNKLGQSGSTNTITGTTDVVGTTTINDSNGIATTKINTGSTTGAVTIGNVNVSSVDIEGTTTINSSVAKNTQIGSATSYTGIGGAADASYALKVTGATNITGNLTVGGAITGTFIPTSTILPYAGATAPTGYLLCSGAAISRITYATLFGVIGTTYGSGDGSTTFNIPDLQAYFPVGFKSGDANFGTLGGSGGSKTFTLATTNLPAHNHSVTDPGHTHTISQTAHSHTITDPGHTHTVPNYNSNGSTNIRSGGTNQAQVADATNSANTGVTVNTTSITISNNSATTGITTDNTGSDTAVTHLQPYLTINYIIKY